MEKIQLLLGSYSHDATDASEDLSLLHASLEVVQGYNEGALSITEAESCLESIAEQVRLLLDGSNLDFQSARDILCNLLSVGIDSCFQQIQKLLLPLFNYRMLAQDMLNERVEPLFSIEEKLAVAIEQGIRRGITDRDNFLGLLELYDMLLEHIWLLGNLTTSPAEKAIFDQEVIPCLRRADAWMILLEGENEPILGLARRRVRVKQTCRRMNVPLNLIQKAQLLEFVQNAHWGSFLHSLGETYSTLEDHEKALRLFEEAQTTPPIESDSISPEQQAFRMGQVGIECRKVGYYDKAIFWHHKQLDIAENKGIETEKLNAYNGLGLAFRRLGNFPAALEYLNKASNLASQNRRFSEWGTIKFNIANVLRSVEQYEDAIRNYHQAGEMAAMTHDYPSIQKISVSLGITYELLGQFQRAINSFHRGLQLGLRLNYQGGIGKALHGLGSVYCRLSDWPRAINFSLKATHIAAQIGDLNGIEAGNSVCVVCLRKLGLYEKALAINKTTYEAALKHNPAIQVPLLLSLGEDYRSLKRYEEALSHAQRAQETARRNEDKQGEGDAYSLLSEIYFCQGRLEDAFGASKRALAIFSEIDLKQRIAATNRDLGFICLKKGNFQKSSEHFHEALNIYLSFHLSLKDYQSRITVFEQTSVAYRGLEMACLRLGDIAQALLISDRRRSYSLNDHLRQKYSCASLTTRESFSSDDMQRVVDAERSTFVVYTTGSGEEDNITLGVWVLRPDEEIVFREFTAPIFLGNVDTNGVPALPKSVFSGGRASPDLDELFANLPSQHLTNEVRDERSSFLSDWYNELIEPINDLLPSDPDALITFVPEGPLSLVPFPVLRAPNGEYLIQRHTVRNAPSIETLHLIAERNPRRSSNQFPLIVGDPTTDLAILNFAETEASDVAALHEGARLITKDEASPKRFLAMAEQASRIHISSHADSGAKSEDVTVFHGALCFSPDEDEEDGNLYASQIKELRLNADVVFLAACQTGQGVVLNEGIIGPTYAFLAGGARSVISTLWNLKDASINAQMTTLFYAHINGQSDLAEVLGRPFGRAEALRQVFLKAIEMDPHSPLDWGGIILTGEAQSIPDQE